MNLEIDLHAIKPWSQVPHNFIYSLKHLSGINSRQGLSGAGVKNMIAHIP